MELVGSIILGIILAVLSGLATAGVAERWERVGVIGFLIGVLFPVLGLFAFVYLLFARPVEIVDSSSSHPGQAN